MNKKSNIIIGLSILAVIVAVVAGMSLMSGAGKKDAPAKAAGVTQAAAVVQPKEANFAEVGQSGSSSPRQAGSFVASKQGKKYFPVDCGSAKTIKEENRVYFGSESEAEGAGYTRTATCK